MGEKIEDWFEYAKTPEQKVVYRFLKDIKDEEYENNNRDINSAMSADSAVSDKAQSLEDILDNLKKYWPAYFLKRGGGSKIEILYLIQIFPLQKNKKIPSQI